MYHSDWEFQQIFWVYTWQRDVRTDANGQTAGFFPTGCLLILNVLGDIFLTHIATIHPPTCVVCMVSGAKSSTYLFSIISDTCHMCDLDSTDRCCHQRMQITSRRYWCILSQELFLPTTLTEDSTHCKQCLTSSSQSYQILGDYTAHGTSCISHKVTITIKV